MANPFAETIKELLLYVDEKSIKENCMMKDYTTFKVGGPASVCIFPGTIAELFCSLEVLEKKKCKHIVIGNGSNLLFSDEGYKGVVIRIGSGIDRIRVEGNIIFAEAGALLSNVSKAAAEAGLSGMEFAAGIPGSLGGAVYMNAGAYDGEMKAIVHSVSSIAKNGMMKDRPCDALEFSYRSSIFQRNGETILGVKLRLTPGDLTDITIKMREYNQKRASKQPLQQASAGSFFRRPEGCFAGQLIEESGLKGLSCGGAQVSALHAGFIVNTGKATAEDIKNLMCIIQETVYDKTGVFLEPEVKIIS